MRGGLINRKMSQFSKGEPKMSYYYLASPYSHPDGEVREGRYLRAQRALEYLLANKMWAYSPIVHCHPLAKRFSMPKDAKFWEEYNHVMIDHCDSILVLQIPGWEESIGVAEEMAYARWKKLVCNYMQPVGYYKYRIGAPA